MKLFTHQKDWTVRSQGVSFWASLFGLVMVVLPAACSKKAPETGAQPLIQLVSGSSDDVDQAGAPGKKFEKQIVFKVVSSDSGSPMPGVSILIEPLDQDDDSSHVTPNFIVSSADGTAQTVAIGGPKGLHSSKFKASIIRGASLVEFNLTTAEEEGPKAEIVQVDKEVEVQVPVKEENVEKYLVTTTGNGLETAGVPFGIAISGVNKAGLVVTSYKGEKDLVFNLKQKPLAVGSKPTVLLDGNFDKFPPTQLTKLKVNFVDGVATVDDAYTIRQILSDMFIYAIAPAENLSGESSVLKVNVGMMQRIEIASGETKAQFVAGQKINGPDPTNVGGFSILADDSQAMPFSAGATLALQTNGFDVFENRFPDTIPSIWTAYDVGVSVPAFPATPLMPSTIALQSSAVGMNLFIPTQDALGFMKAVHTRTMPNGTPQVFTAKTGVFKVVSNRPTTYLVDAFTPTGDGSIPLAGALPLTTLKAGSPIWLRIRAANSLSVIDTNWTQEADVTFYIGNVVRSPGWPLLEDGGPAGGDSVASIGGVSIFDDTSGSPAYASHIIPVSFTNGVAWVRQWVGQGGVPVGNRPMADLVFYTADEEPVVNTNDIVNALSGTAKLPKIKPGTKAHLKLAFNDTTVVPVGYETSYPAGIDIGTKLNDFAVEVGRGVVLASIAYDTNGNKIGLSSATWKGINGMPNFYLAYYNQAVKINILSPADLLGAPGRIEITDVDDISIKDQSGDITTRPGLPDRFQITTLTSPKAGTKFGIRITALDAASNVSASYNDTTDLLISVSGNPTAPLVSWFPSVPAFNTHQTLMGEYAAQKLFSAVTFVNGVYEIPATDPLAFLFYRSVEKPVIQVQTPGNAVNGQSDPLNIDPEALYSLKAFFVTAMTSDDNGTPVTYAAGSQVGDVILSADSVMKVESKGYDRFSNSRGSVDVNWTNDQDDGDAVNPILIANYNGHPNNFAISSNSSFTVYRIGTTGFAYIKFATPPGACGTTYVCDPAAGPIVGYTGKTDGRVGSPIAVKVVPDDPLNPPHSVGQSFAMKIQLLDVNGLVATNFNQTINVTSVIVNHLPGEDMSAKGDLAIKPGPQPVAIVNGVGVLAGFKNFNIYDQPTINITATLTDGTPLSNLLGLSPVQTFQAAAPNYIQLVNLPQNDGVNPDRGPKHRPAQLSSLTVYPTTVMDLWSGMFDQYGNWAGDAAANWTLESPCNNGTVTYPNGFVSFLVPDGPLQHKAHLNPGATAPGNACIRLTKIAPTIPVNTFNLYNVTISVGTPAKLKLIVIDPGGKKATQNLGGGIDIETGFQLVADAPIRMRVEFFDGANSPTSGASDTNHAFTVSFIGAQAGNVTECPSIATPKQVLWGTTPITGTPQLVNADIVNGVVLNTAYGNFYVPKAGTPFDIKVETNYDNGSGPVAMTAGLITGLTVVPSALNHVNLRSDGNGAGSLYQGTLQNMTTDVPLLIYAAGYDHVCNFIADQNSAWTATNVVSGKLVGNITTGKTVIAQPNTAGTGNIKANAVALIDVPCAFCGNLDVNVTAGTVSSLAVTTQHNGNERATVPFTFNVVAKDNFGNVVNSFAGSKALTFAWDASDGLNGTFFAQKPVNGTTYTFTGGSLDVASFVNDTFRLVGARAGQTVTLTVSHNTGTKIVSGTVSFAVANGPVSDVKMFNITDTEFEVSGTPDLETDTYPVFAMKGFDAAGNPFGNLNSNWSTTGTLAPAATFLDKTVGTFVVVDPGVLGPATIKASFWRNDADLPPAMFLEKTINVAVVPGKAKRILALTEQQFNQQFMAGPSSYKETAGVGFNLKVVAVDGSGIIDTKFDNTDVTRGVNYGILNFSVAVADADLAWPTPPSFPASFGSATFAFVGGVATVPNFRLHKAKETPRFTVTMTTPVPHVTNGSGLTGSILIQPAATQDLRIIKLDAGGNQTVVPVDGSGTLIASISTDQQVQFYAIGHDAFGNYTEPLEADWTGSADAAGHLNPIKDQSTYLAPSQVGSGKITAVATAATTIQGSTYTTESIPFTSGKVDHFDVSAPATVTANQFFAVTIIAKDKKNNPVAVFPASGDPDGQLFDIWFQGATVSPSSASFPGAVDSVPPASGAPMLVTPTFSAGNAYDADIAGVFKLTNEANNTVKLKIKWNDGTKDYFGESNQIDVLPGAISFYRITKVPTGSLDLLASDAVAIGDPLIYYANGFDAVGNFVGNQSVLWKGTKALLPILKSGASDLIATNIVKAPKKVKSTLTGLFAENVVDTADVEIYDSISPGAPFATLTVNLSPGVPSKVVAYVSSTGGDVPVTTGQVTLPQQVMAGAINSFRIEIQDSEGNRTGYNGTKNISVQLPNADLDKSTLGWLPTVNQPSTSAAFNNGIWFISSKKTTFNKTGASTMTVMDNDATPLAVQTTNVSVVTDNVAAHIRPTDGNTAIANIFQPATTPLNREADVGATFWAAQYDAGGNWLGTAPVTWTGLDNLANPVVAAGNTGPTITFTPAVASINNRLSMAWDHDANNGTPDLAYQLTKISITANSNLKEFVITTTNPTGPTITADGCFDLFITAKDSSNNTALTYNGNFILNFTTTNAFTPNYAGMLSQNVKPTSGITYPIVSGQGGPYNFCLRDVTAGAVIMITDPNTNAIDLTPVKGQFTMAVTHGVPSKIEFSEGVRDGQDEPTAFGPTCDLTLNADLVNKPIYATVHDLYGNLISAVGDPQYPVTSGWNWAVGGVLNMAPATFNIIDKTIIQLTPKKASMLTAGSESGMGTLNITSSGLSICAGQPLKVHVEPGAAKSFTVVANAGANVVATSPFSVAMTAKDQFGNAAWTIDGQTVDLNFAWSDTGVAMASPSHSVDAPYLPVTQSSVIASPVISAAFSNGIYTTTVINRLPNSLQDEQNSIKFQVTATQPAGIAVSESSNLVVVPGPKSRIYLTTNPVTGIPVVQHNLAISYKDPQTLYAASYDSYGNFVSGGEQPTWTVQGYDYITDTPTAGLVELTGALLTNKTLQTKTLASGQKVTGARGVVSLVHGSLGTYAVSLKFNPDPATKFIATKFINAGGTVLGPIEGIPTPSVTAGQEYYIVVEARDDLGNVDVSFPATFNLEMSVTAPDKTQYTAIGNPVHTAILPLDEDGLKSNIQHLYTFDSSVGGWPGVTWVGPFTFVSAGVSHAVNISDDDPSRVVATAQDLPNITVQAGVLDHFRFTTVANSPPDPLDLVLAPITINPPSKSLYSGSFDFYGNFINYVKANYTWEWKAPCTVGSCAINVSGNTTSTGVITPVSSGVGNLRLTANAPLSGTYLSPDLTINAGDVSSFVVQPLFVDQDAGTIGIQPLLIGQLNDLANRRTFSSEADPQKRHQRAMIPFTLRIKALDNNNNLKGDYCHLTVCQVVVNYPASPSLGPDGLPALPADGTVLNVKFDSGYGTFVNPTGDDLIFPFIMHKARESITIQVTESGGAASGTSNIIPVEPGVLSSLKFHKLANDISITGGVYLDPIVSLIEGQTVHVVAAGYDVANNYARDFIGNWSHPGSKVSFIPDGTGRSEIDLYGDAMGSDSVTASISAGNDTDGQPYGAASGIWGVNVQAAPPVSYKVTLVDVDGSTPIVNGSDLNGDTLANDAFVKAGKLFKVRVEARTGPAGTGVLATSYSGAKTLNFNAINSQLSTLAYDWQKPTNGVANQYTFAGGFVVLDGLKFTGIPAANNGAIDLTITNVDATLSGHQIIHNLAGDAGEVRIARGPLASSELLVNNSFFTVNQQLELYAMIYDEGGNWIFQRKADWTYRGAIPPSAQSVINGVSAANGGPFNSTVLAAAYSLGNPLYFAPQSIIGNNSGEIEISVNEGGPIFTHTATGLTVTGNTADHFDLSFENAGVWDAVSCYNLSVTAKDGANNPAPYYDGAKTLNWQLLLSDGTTPYPTLIGGQNPPPKEVIKLANGTQVFTSGGFSAPAASFCLRDATAVPGNQVLVKVSDPNGGSAISGQGLVTVNIGPAAKYYLAETETEAMPVCGPQPFQAGDQKDYWLHETDAVGNFIQRLNTPTWTGVNALVTAGSLTPAANNGIHVTFKSAGVGSLRYNTGAGAKVLECVPTFDISPSPATKFLVTNSGGPAGEVATAPFTTTVSIVDAFGNVRNDATGTISIRMSTNAVDSPMGIKPVIAGAADAYEKTFNMAFTNGVWDSSLDGSNSAFQFPKAYGAWNLTVEATNPPEVQTVFAPKVHTDGLAATTKLNIVTIAGPASTIQIRDGLNQSDAVVNAAWVVSHPIETVGETLLYAIEADAVGNYTGTTNLVSWNLTGLPPLLASKGSPGSYGYDPNATGTGTITVTATSGPLNGQAYTTPTITVNQAPASEWRIKPWLGGSPLAQITAGQLFKIRVEAADGSGVVDAGFNQVETVTIETLGFSPAKIPFSQWVPSRNCSTAPALATPCTAGVAPTGNNVQASEFFDLTFVNGVAYIDDVVFFNDDDTLNFRASGGGMSPSDTTLALVDFDVVRGPFETTLIDYNDGDYGTGSKVLTAEKTMTVSLLGIDLYGNSYGFVSGTIGLTNAGITDYDGWLAATDSYDMLTNSWSRTVLGGVNNSTVFSPIRVGHGFITFSCGHIRCTTKTGAGSLNTISAELTVNPGPAVNFLVEVEGVSSVDRHVGDPWSPTKYVTVYTKSAGEVFDVRVTAVDLHDNVATGFVNDEGIDGQDLVFAYDTDGDEGTDNSAALVALSSPTVPSAATDFKFFNGVWLSRLAAPNFVAADTPFKLTKAGANPYLRVKRTSGDLKGITPEKIIVAPGALALLEFQKEASNAPVLPSNIHDGSGCLVTASIPSGTLLRLYMAGYDIEKNYISDELVNWQMTKCPATGGTPCTDEASMDKVTTHTNGGVYNLSATAQFTPSTMGDWKVKATSVANAAVNSELCLNATEGGAAKFKAHIVYDKDGDRTINGADVDLALPAAQAVNGGDCFSLELQALDVSDNLVTTFNGTIGIDFVSDAPNGDVGFKPIPNSTPTIMTLTFAGGKVITPPINGAGHPVQDPAHRCAQASSRGSFVMQKATSGFVPATNYIRVSDGAGAGVGLIDDQIDIAVNIGTVSFVGLLARTSANEANPDKGIHLGTSKVLKTTFNGSGATLADPTTWVPNSAQGIYDTHKCSTDGETSGYCTIAGDGGFATYVAGTTGSIKYHRFYLGAYDSGGNYLGAPTGDWTSSYTSMGKSSAADPQWSLTPAPTGSYFEQYVAAGDAVFPGQPGAASDISNVSEVYYYPLKPGRNLRLAVDNVQFGGQTFVVANRYSIEAAPDAWDHIRVETDKGNYKAGEGPDISVYMYDRFNNELWVNVADIAIGLEYQSGPGVSVRDAIRRNIALGGTENFGLTGVKTYPEFILSTQQQSIKTANDYRITAQVTMNAVVKNASKDIKVWGADPLGIMPIMPSFTPLQNDICNVDITIDGNDLVEAAVFDRYGNYIQRVKYGWYAATGPTQYYGFGGKQEEFLDPGNAAKRPTYYDETGALVAPELVGDWNFSYKARMKPIQSGAKGGYYSFVYNSSEFGVPPASITITEGGANNPNFNQVFNGIPLVDLGTSGDLLGDHACAFQNASVLDVWSAPATKLVSAFAYGMSGTPAIGDRIDIQVKALDRFDNDASNLLGETGLFNFSFTNAANAPAICAKRKMDSGGKCDVSKDPLQGPREWEALHELNPVIADPMNFNSYEAGNVHDAHGTSTARFRQVNSANDPAMTVCFNNPGPGTLNPSRFSGLTGKCAPELPWALLKAPAVDLFILRFNGLHLDTLPEAGGGGGAGGKRTWTTDDTDNFVATRFDKFGNSVGNVPTEFAAWVVSNVVDEDLVAAPNTLLSDQFANFATKPNPLVLGGLNRVPVQGEIKASYLTYSAEFLEPEIFGANQPIKLVIENAPPGSNWVYFYDTADFQGSCGAGQYCNAPEPGDSPGERPGIETGRSRDVGTTRYATLQIKSDSSGDYKYNEPVGAPITWSWRDAIATSEGDIGTLPVNDTDVKFCNGWAVIDSFNFSNCPVNTDPPLQQYIRVFPFVIKTTLTEPNIFASVNISGYNSTGWGPVLDWQPLAAHHYRVALSPTAPAFYNLISQGGDLRTKNPITTNIEGASVDIFAADIYGNNTTVGIPGTESGIRLRVVSSQAITVPGFCAEGVAVGSCANNQFIFRCAAGNCLDFNVDMTSGGNSGAYSLNDVEINTPGIYYLIAESRTQTAGLDTVDPAADSSTKSLQVTKRAARLDLRCDRNCIDKFNITYPTNVNVGTSFAMNITAVDIKGRQLNDSSLDLSLDSSTFTWDPDLKPTYADGGSPGTGFVTNFDFTGGAATANLKFNKVGTVPTAKINFTMDGTATAANPLHDLIINAVPASRFVIETTDTGGNPVVVTDRNADSSGTFNLKVRAYDPGDNLVSNPTAVNLKPSNKNTGPYTGASMGDFSSYVCTFVAGVCQMNGLYYKVAATVDVVIQGQVMTGSTYPAINFHTTSSTVSDYEMTSIPGNDTYAWDGVNGTPGDSISIYALDGAGNRIWSYVSERNAADTYLNGRTISTANTQAGYTSTEGCHTANVASFTDGRSSCPLYINKAGTIGSGKLALVVNAVTQDTNVSPILVNYNVLNNIKICSIDADCGGSNHNSQTVTKVADGSTYPFYVKGYDYYGNYRGTETSAAWALSNPVPGILTGGTHYTYSDASGVASFKPIIMPQNVTTVDLTATIAPATAQWVRVSYDANATSKVAIITRTDTSGALTAANSNFSVTRMEAYYTVDAADYLDPTFDGNLVLTKGGTVTNTAAGPFTCNFIDGVCTDTVNFSFTAAETTKTFNLTVGGLTTADITGISVVPAVPKDLRITGTTGQTAGTGFNVTVTAFDQFNNQASNFAGDINLTFAWTGTTSTSSFYGAGNSLAAVKPVPRNWTFALGASTSTDAPFKLYKGNDASPVLSITADDNATVTTYQSMNGFTTADAALNYVKILQVSTANTAWTDELTTHSMTTAETKQLWTHGYDMYGNWISLENVNWSANQGYLAFTGGTGVDTITINPSVTGTGGIVTADHATVTDDTTGAIDVTPGVLDHFVVTVNSPSPVAAGSDISVTVTAQDIESNTVTSFTGAQTVAWSWINATNAPAGTAPKVAATSVTFTNGVFNSGAGDFKLYNDADTNDQLRIVASTKQGTSSGIAVDPGAISKLFYTTAALSQDSTQCGSITVEARDTWDNVATVAGNTTIYTTTTTSGQFYSNGGCSTLLTGSPQQTTIITGASSATYYYKDTTVGTPTLTADENPSQTWTAATQAATITAGPLASIRLNNTDAAPGAHLANIGCTQGTTINCPRLYAFGYDVNNNSISGTGFACGSWSYTTSNGAPWNSLPPTMDNAAGHHSLASTSNWHVNGSVRCDTGGVFADTTMDLTMINKNYSWSCGNWSCSSGAPNGTCTVSQSTGYTSSAYTFGGQTGGTTLTTTSCDSGMTTGNNCPITVNGVTGNASGALTVSATVTAAQTTFASMLNPATAQVQSGAVAPNCANDLGSSVGSWSCSGGEGRINVTLTNNNALQSATLANADPGFSPVNNFAMQTSVCKNSVIGTSGGNCVDTIKNPVAGEATSVQYSLVDGYFNNTNVALGASPNCSQAIDISLFEVVNACAGLSKRVRYTLKNLNSIEALTFNAGAVAVTGDDPGVVFVDNCSTSSLSLNQTCTIEIDYVDATNSAPAANNTSVTVTPSNAYFSTLVIGTGDGNNQCP